MKDKNPKFLLHITQRPDAMQAISTKLEYKFNDFSLLSDALTHASALRYARVDGEQPEWLPRLVCNERLEFLGDTVLDLVISESLFQRSAEASEGDLSRQRAMLVCEESLAQKGKMIGISSAILLGPAEFRDGLQFKESVIADAFEALLAAVYLDGGFSSVHKIIKSLFANELEQSISQDHDFKTKLQEWLQARFKEVPEYITENCSGEAHSPRFSVSVKFRDQTLGSGIGASKKKASQDAAQIVLNKLINGELQIGEKNND